MFRYTLKNTIYKYIYIHSIYRRMHCLSNKHVLTLTACIISPVWSDCTMHPWVPCGPSLFVPKAQRRDSWSRILDMKHRQCLRSWEKHSPHQSDWCPEVLFRQCTDTAHMGSMNRSPPAFILLVIVRHPHSMVSTCLNYVWIPKGQPWLGWREGTQTGPLWRLACPACSPSDRLQPPHSIAHFKRSKGKATKPVNLRRMARWGPTDALGRPDKSAETPIHGNMYKTHNKYEQYIKTTNIFTSSCDDPRLFCWARWRMTNPTISLAS